MAFTNPEQRLPGPAALHSLGMAPSQPTFLTSEGRWPPNYANSPISVGGSSVRLEKDFSILSDSSHDKIPLPLQTCALDLGLQRARLKLSDSHLLLKRA